MATRGIGKFGRNPRRTVDYIIATKPPYRDIQRSWRTLGYMNQAKPAEDEFRDHVDQLWQDLDPHQFADGRQLKRAQKARRYILAAIDALGWYSSPRFSAAAICNSLNLTDQDIATRPHGHWQALPAPLSVREYTTYARRPARRENALREDQYREYPPRHDAPNHIVDVPDVYRNQWQRYHRYYNFVAEAGDGTQALFRALPVPRNQWSLWHSVAYQVSHTPDSPGSIHSYLEVKSRIWVFFERHLRDISSIRWRAFVLMQLMSRFADPLWGELSVLRCLHRNEEDAGLPAYPSEGPGFPGGGEGRAGDAVYRQPEELFLLRAILQLISEYYGREVILFYPPVLDISHQPVPPREDPAATARIDPRAPQDDQAYGYLVVGSNNNDYNNQILLATDDLLHFDPVVFVGESQGARFDTSNRYGDRRYIPMPWTHRDYEARPHNTPQEVRALNCPGPLGFVPATVNAAHPGYHEPPPVYLRYFRTKRDIPGRMLNLPEQEWCMANWNAERNGHDVLNDGDREGHIRNLAPRDDAYQIRHGPLVDGVRPLESMLAYDGARMILQALDSGKDGVLVARSHKLFLEGDFPEK